MIDWTKWKPTVAWAERMIKEDDWGRGYLYMETGLMKPWSVATINALLRRGYRVEKQCDGVYYAYPKGA